MNNPLSAASEAALIVQAGASLNSLNATLRALSEFRSADKKLQNGWAELRQLSSRIYTRLIGRLDGPTGDYINELLSG